METELKLCEIWIYPVKSLGGISLPSAEILKKGLRHDRRFMLVDDDGVALTQRKYPRMALFSVEISGDRCIVKFSGQSIEWPVEPTSFSAALSATVWDDVVEVREVDRAISQWFSTFLQKSCRLVYFPEENPRPIEKKHWPEDDHVSLADAYPLLIIGKESLADLNRRLPAPVPMNRFRPNLVFTGGTPFVEDTWSDFRIADNRFRAVKPCARCVLTTVDQDTAATGAEPLRTLTTYRKENNKVYFGQNIVIIDAAGIKTGDRIFIDSYR